MANAASEKIGANRMVRLNISSEAVEREFVPTNPLELRAALLFAALLFCLWS